MKKEELACGDVVIVNEFEKIYEAIIIAHGINNQPLIIRIDDLTTDVWNPQWTTYDCIIDAPHRINIKKALAKEYKKLEKMY